jgi:hypothetical protein
MFSKYDMYARTHTHIYIYIHVCVQFEREKHGLCVGLCVREYACVFAHACAMCVLGPWIHQNMQCADVQTVEVNLHRFAISMCACSIYIYMHVCIQCMDAVCTCACYVCIIMRACMQCLDVYNT